MQSAPQHISNNTKWEFVPLDKMIPLNTGINFFAQEYKKFKGNYHNRANQRLREIYFSLFACRVLDILEKKDHLLVFHQRQDYNDVSFILIDESGEKGTIQYFDVKEYLDNDSDNFEQFFEKILKKWKTKDYNLIIGINRDTEAKLDLSKIDRTIIFVSNTDSKNENPFKSRVLMVSKHTQVFHELIDLSVLYDPSAQPVIFHDRINIHK